MTVKDLRLGHSYGNTTNNARQVSGYSQVGLVEPEKGCKQEEHWIVLFVSPWL